MLVILDLDDTLITGSGRKPGVPIVPRQTFHALRKLRHAGAHIVVTSFNPSAVLWVNMLLLTPFVSRVFYSCKGDRAALVLEACAHFPTYHPVHYFDDREDNIDAVRRACGDDVTCHIVLDPFLLHCQLKDVISF